MCAARTISPGQLSVIVPSKNEETGLESILPALQALLPGAEILVVDDGSTDGTVEVCRRHRATVVHHPYSKGNGAAVKSGARAASREYLLFLDADGQHPPDIIPLLLAKMCEGYDMVVGARTLDTHAGTHRAIANSLYNRFASWFVRQRIADLTSGFRCVRADHFRRFLYLLPNGFSYPTTITMAFFRAGHSVAYVPFAARQRSGRSHISVWRDGIRFLLIIFKIGTLYSPLKLFLPISLGFFALGLGHYLMTFLQSGRFTNMSALLFITSVLVFLIGLVSEQITALHYKDTDSA
jgi:glycosyltransferase involved in cell wall biosynthesis